MDAGVIVGSHQGDTHAGVCQVIRQHHRPSRLGHKASPCWIRLIQSRSQTHLILIEIWAYDFESGIGKNLAFRAPVIVV